MCNGTPGDDEMTGTSSTDYIYADGGNDTLRGLGAFDDLRGGPGNDTLDGGGGNDQYNVYDINWGSDRISADSSAAKDWLIFQIPDAVIVDLKPSSARAEVTSCPTRSTSPRMWLSSGSRPEPAATPSGATTSTTTSRVLAATTPWPVARATTG